MHRIKSFGYLISSISVILLTIVSWSKASQSTLLATCLIAGSSLSILGMFCRWITYEIEERRKRSG